VSVQLDPPLGGNIRGLVELSQALKDSGRVGFVDVNDNAGARAGMNAIIFSAVVERSTGIETIPHLTTRDYTIMGLEAVLFGAHAEGVRNVLAVTGDPPEVGDYPGSQGIYEIDSIGLTELMSKLNRGEDYNGRPIDAPTSFFIGVAVNPTADDLDLELERDQTKVDAGAHFAMTQLVFDLAHLDQFFDRFGGPSPIPLLIGICPVWSYRFALRLHNELPGIVVPEPLQEALRDAGTDAAAVGMAYARDLYAAAREKAAGVYLVAPYRKPLNVLDLIDD
jgi:5,10-methylenetetrahydrofolate reductase